MWPGAPHRWQTTGIGRDREASTSIGTTDGGGRGAGLKGEGFMGAAKLNDGLGGFDFVGTVENVFDEVVDLEDRLRNASFAILF
jgi:hypothetical protein